MTRARAINVGSAYTVDRWAVCEYDADCENEVSPRFPGIKLCTPHAVRVHDMVEATLALEQLRGEVAEERSRFHRARAQNYGAVVEEWRPAIKDEPGYVYYIRFDGMVKIGFSRNPTRRLKDLPHEEVLRVVEGGKMAERQAHVACAGWRVVGEWFRDCPEFRAAAGLDTPPSDG